MTGIRPLTRAQRLQNAAFLRELARTGNAREAARRMGIHRACFTRRRAKHPLFATQWDAALALAQAALKRSQADKGEPHLVRYTDGRVQLRRPRPGQIDLAARNRFLLALSASANVRLAAKAAGFSHAGFYAHKRADPVFAEQWQDALERGWERLEAALLAGWSDEPDSWRENEPPAIPPMSVNQALQLLYLHHRTARLTAEPEPLRRRRGEPQEVRVLRLQLVHEARLQRQRDLFDRAEAARQAARERPAAAQFEPAPITLPDLAQVTGWSKASGKPPHNPDRALFGGWRLGDRERD